MLPQLLKMKWNHGMTKMFNVGFDVFGAFWLTRDDWFSKRRQPRANPSSFCPFLSFKDKKNWLNFQGEKRAFWANIRKIWRITFLLAWEHRAVSLFSMIDWIIKVFLSLPGISNSNQDPWHGSNRGIPSGIDLSQVQDLPGPHEIDIPTATDLSGDSLYTGIYSGPYFDLQQMKNSHFFDHYLFGDGIGGVANLTAQVGSTVTLPCVVKQVGKNAVSKQISYKKKFNLNSSKI